jgi:AraC family transcriptional regulator
MPSIVDDAPRRLDARVDRTTRLVFRGSGYVLGRFHCPPGDRRWREENFIGDVEHIVFPTAGTVVRILRAGRDPLVATANEVVFYNRGTFYRREEIGRDGDRCMFAALDPWLADELAADSGAAGAAGGPFPFQSGWMATGVFALQRAVAHGLGRNEVDPPLLDESVLTLLGDATRVAAARDGQARARRPRGHQDTVEAVKELLAASASARPCHPLPLAEVARRVHYSPYHLARLFRARTGQTIHGYWQQLRVRGSIDRVLGGREPLALIAADLGFASHSHFTTTFGKAFGIRPAEARRGAGAATLRRLHGLARVGRLG